MEYHLPGAKGVQKARMKQIFSAIAKVTVNSFLLATVIGGVIVVIGYINKWDSMIKYSNGFFLAGCLMIIAGASSRYAASQGWLHYQLLSADSFRTMSSGERVDYIVKISSSFRTLILGIVSGLFLILASAVAAYLL